MLTVLVHKDGVTRRVDTIDPAWLQPDAREIFWADIEAPGEDDRRMMLDLFHFHDLAVEDAMSDTHHPKIESYETFLYMILHRIVPGEEGFVTEDVDFFLGRNYVLTVHGKTSPSIETERGICEKHSDVLAEGAGAILHRIIDRMVDRYRPAVDTLEDRLEALENVVFEQPKKNPLRDILALKRDVASLRRISLPQRDAVSRLARREFPQIPENLSYRFRDVYDHLVRITDEAVFFQDRVTGLLDVYLSNQSNRMNQVMKVLTVISTVFLPLTVLTGLWGINVPLPAFPGTEHGQFWWLIVLMVGITGAMLWAFFRMDWL